MIVAWTQIHTNTHKVMQTILLCDRLFAVVLVELIPISCVVVSSALMLDSYFDKSLKSRKIVIMPFECQQKQQ